MARLSQNQMSSIGLLSPLNLTSAMQNRWWMWLLHSVDRFQCHSPSTGHYFLPCTLLYFHSLVANGLENYKLINVILELWTTEINHGYTSNCMGESCPWKDLILWWDWVESNCWSSLQTLNFHHWCLDPSFYQTWKHIHHYRLVKR